MKSNPYPIAYCSMNRSFSDMNPSDYNALLHYFKNMDGEAEFLAEEIHPEENSRPMWEALICKIKKKECSEVVLPSLNHVAGNDDEKLLAFLKLVGESNIPIRILRNEIH